VAWNNNNNNGARKPENPLDAKGRAILTQVAFKEAVASAIANGMAIESPEFIQRLEFLTDALTTQVEVEVKKQAPAVAAAPAASMTPGEATDLLVDEFGAALVKGDDAFGVRIKGKAHGPIPGWLVDQAAAKGIHEVWDNRDRIQGTKRPHFKAVDGDTAFWPPKG
jgi:hypothetical protein